MRTEVFRAALKVDARVRRLHVGKWRRPVERRCGAEAELPVSETGELRIRDSKFHSPSLDSSKIHAGRIKVQAGDLYPAMPQGAGPQTGGHGFCRDHGLRSKLRPLRHRQVMQHKRRTRKQLSSTELAYTGRPRPALMDCTIRCAKAVDVDKRRRHNRKHQQCKRGQEKDPCAAYFPFRRAWVFHCILAKYSMRWNIRCQRVWSKKCTRMCPMNPTRSAIEVLFTWSSGVTKDQYTNSGRP